MVGSCENSRRNGMIARVKRTCEVVVYEHK